MARFQGASVVDVFIGRADAFPNGYKRLVETESGDFLPELPDRILNLIPQLTVHPVGFRRRKGELFRQSSAQSLQAYG